MAVTIRSRFSVDDVALSRLHSLAFFGHPDAPVQPWAERLARHGLTWVGAFDDELLVGFVQVCWDGGRHAFLLDTVVAPERRRRGIGRSLVQRAVADVRSAGCEWLHVDHEPHLTPFYRACGFRPTEAGLLHLV